MNSDQTSGSVRVGAIDCGTNSIRLLVADVDATESSEDARGSQVPGLHDVVREMVITRLGQGVDRTGILDPEAIERTLAVTKDYQNQIDELGVQRSRFVATSASRDARNRDVFVEGVRRITGADPQVISGTEEAHLSFTGALSALPAGLAGPYMVVDIGGGSTEFVLGVAGSHGGAVRQSISVDMGSVRVTERFASTDPDLPQWGAENLARAREWIDAKLDQAQQTVDLASARTVVGVAGTVTSIAAFIAGVHVYSPSVTHGLIPTPRQWADAINFMIEEPIADKAALGFMPLGRADVIGGGALVWERVLVRLGILPSGADEGSASEGSRDGTNEAGDSHARVSAVVSEHDILDGLALSLAQPAR